MVKFQTPEARAKIAAYRTGKKLSESTKEKLRIFHTGRKHTPETIEKLRAAKLGKPRDPEVMKRLHEASRGKKRTPEQRAKISAACKGRIISQEQRDKISATLTGKPGHKHTPESRAKMSASRKTSPAALEQLATLHENHCGENSHFWKGGVSFEPYCPKFNKPLKNKVRKFFGDKCVFPGCNCTSESNWGAALSVHHVFTEKMACCETRIEEMEAVRRRLPARVAHFGKPEFSPLEIIYIRMMVPLCKKHHGIVENEPLEMPYEETVHRKYLADLIIQEYDGKCF